jgi:hypothetical protein
LLLIVPVSVTVTARPAPTVTAVGLTASDVSVTDAGALIDAVKCASSNFWSAANDANRADGVSWDLPMTAA